MEWEQCMQHDNIAKKDIRHASVIDIDKIIFSSKFRALQDKTQVYPLSKGNVVRTRLTHSLEVSSVGRSLGYLIGKFVLENKATSKDFKAKISPNDFANHVAAACMIHDIGNPPFGHAGEDAIQEFFTELFLNKENTKGLTPNQRQDFLKFNGNAQGFLLTSGKHKKGSLSVSKPTLGAFVKYPCTSNDNTTYNNKYCITEKNKQEYQELADFLGIPKIGKNVWARHPLVFLTEAADDICYCIADIEDGILLGDIRYDIAEEYLLNIAVKDKDFELEDFKNLESLQDKLSYLRGRIINYLIFQVQDIFIENESKILAGNFINESGSYIPLLELLQQDDRKSFEEFKNIAKEYLFKEQEKLELEIKGVKAIKVIIEQLIQAMKNKKQRESKLIFSYTANRNFAKMDYEKDRYNTFLEITSYISLLTDHNLMQVAKKMKLLKNNFN